MDAASVEEPLNGYQPSGHAWDPQRPDILTLLQDSLHSDVQPIYYGSNHCFLVLLDAGEKGKSFSVYKPAIGEYPLYDFSSGSLYRREVAAWVVNDVLGWNLIPPTTVTSGEYGVGSLQLYIESLTEGAINVSDLKRLALLDVVLNNADRKAEHCLLGYGEKLWGIDHGLTFHAHTKLRTVLWHFSGTPLPERERHDLTQLLLVLQRGTSSRQDQLRDLLSRPERSALALRVERLLDSGRFPDPRYKPVPYRW